MCERSGTNQARSAMKRGDSVSDNRAGWRQTDAASASTPPTHLSLMLHLLKMMTSAESGREARLGPPRSAGAAEAGIAPWIRILERRLRQNEGFCAAPGGLA